MKTAETEKIVKSTCVLLCNCGCGVLIHLKNGKPVKVEGDPDHPVNKGALCIKGKASLEYLDHPDRLKHPLKRVGEKGEGKWQQISWDEALNTTASELTKTREKYGAESVAFIQGNAKGYSDSYLARLANVFGSPNIASMSYICFHARLRGMLATYGFMSHPDYQYPPSCILLWGANLTATKFPKGEQVLQALKKGSKLIVIDPAETELAKKADIWVKPRPCSDLALALAMINVIITEDLLDKDFIEKWTVGFDKLKTHVKDYPPEKVSDITWVPAETIKEAARLYAASKPAGMYCGNGMDNNINNFQFNRAAAILRAITGNIGRRGGEINWSPTGVRPGNAPEMHQRDAISLEARARRVGAEEGVLPTYFSALPQKLVKAMLTSKPYPIRTAFVQGGGLLQTYSNAQETCKALKSLDFLAVTDFFRTPTAEVADIVLPAATYLEIDNIHNAESAPFTSIIQKVAQVGECWSDYKIIYELAKRLGLRKYFWGSEQEVLDFILKPAGLTFDEFRKAGILTGKKVYDTYKESGFPTPSGKVELYSSQLEAWGFDPLPVHHEPPESPFSEPELAREYPLVLTNSKLPGFVHSAGREIKSLRDSHPEPLVTIHKDTARELGIKEGDWVFIENRRGRIKQKAKLSSSIDPRVIIAEHGWWYPEKDKDMHGWAESNLNVLTSNDPPYARELGSVTLRGLVCKVYKAN
jgi:anaerobic selenocysteine-containing dehydrogenase